MTEANESRDRRADPQSLDDILFADSATLPGTSTAIRDQGWEQQQPPQFVEVAPAQARADADLDLGADVSGENAASPQPAAAPRSRAREHQRSAPPQPVGRSVKAQVVPVLLGLAGLGGAAWLLFALANPVLAGLCGALGLSLAALTWFWMR